MIYRLSLGFTISVFFTAMVYFSDQFPLVTVSVFAIMIAAALWEFYLLAMTKRQRPLKRLGVGTSIALTFALYFQFPADILLYLALITSFITFMRGRDAPYTNLAVTFFGIIYIALPLSTGVIYLAHPLGKWWLLFVLFVTKVNDVGAYFGGKLLGKRPLAPRISPNKTVEGAFIGTLSSLTMSFAFMYSPLILTYYEALVLGLVLAMLAQIGDLGESLLKRDANVKDSNKIPGLGGTLDMVDSLIFTTPFVYMYVI